MKVPKLILLFLSTIYSSVSAQTGYNFGLTVGSGLNLYHNSEPSDKNHFDFKNSISFYVGGRLIKNVDEKNNLFFEAIYGIKKIEFQYTLNETEIPANYSEIYGKNYSVFSIYFGYRRFINMYSYAFFLEGSVEGDFNNNYAISGRSGFGTTNDVPIYGEYQHVENLDEKTITTSANIGAGINFGKENQFDLGFGLNFPFQNIQKDPSEYKVLLKYNHRDYTHSLKYIGKIYYASLRFTYYFN